jgi:putative transposase
MNDKNFQPTVAIIDSQSVKNSASCTAEVGIDGGKPVKGRKRFYLTDTLGNLLDSFVVPANSYDRTTSAKRWNTACRDKEFCKTFGRFLPTLLSEELFKEK